MQVDDGAGKNATVALPTAPAANVPTGPKNMRTPAGSANPLFSHTPAPNPLVPREPQPSPAVKPFYKVCYACQSRDHLVADCYRLRTSPRSSTSITVKYLAC
jgi:hypothetical protein